VRNLASVLLENIEDVPEVKGDFYRKCYVSLEADSRHLSSAKNIIQSASAGRDMLVA
jgi:hypothetical protein